MFNLYSFYDKKSAYYTDPMTYKLDNHAIRLATLMANDESTMLGRFPQDFDLYLLGTFDESTGKFNILEQPKYILNLVSLVNMPIEERELDYEVRNESSI